MPDNIPFGGGGGGHFIRPFVQNWRLEGCLLIDPLSPVFGPVSKEGGILSPPPTSKVKVKLIKFPIEQFELSFVVSSCEAIYPNLRHLAIENHGWNCILGICKGVILRA